MLGLVAQRAALKAGLPSVNLVTHLPCRIFKFVLSSKSPKRTMITNGVNNKMPMLAVGQGASHKDPKMLLHYYDGEESPSLFIDRRDGRAQQFAGCPVARSSVYRGQRRECERIESGAKVSVGEKRGLGAGAGKVQGGVAR